MDAARAPAQRAVNVMTPQLTDIWVYLAATPLLGLTITLLAYQLAQALEQKGREREMTGVDEIFIALDRSVAVLIRELEALPAKADV